MYSITMAISPDGFSNTPWHWTTKGESTVPPFPWPRTCSLSKSAHVMAAAAAAELPEGAAAGRERRFVRIIIYPLVKVAFQKKPQLLEMAVVFGDLNSASGLKKLDEYLLTRSYITG
ncbi:hypothetical protein Patl1_14720 [Pistacia atlantica]|uniref:Uncharacterized protein n=1 Tax=Pistacia atlantica TaxID=434234 RepID=A0ACC1AYG5_9ROSI|nr:hypothetical protein Patl1_14720 [Pistacia atlantica]